MRKHRTRRSAGMRDDGPGIGIAIEYDELEVDDDDDDEDDVEVEVEVKSRTRDERRNAKGGHERKEGGRRAAKRTGLEGGR